MPFVRQELGCEELLMIIENLNIIEEIVDVC
jgi:hypothetical protein